MKPARNTASYLSVVQEPTVMSVKGWFIRNDNWLGQVETLETRSVSTEISRAISRRASVLLGGSGGLPKISRSNEIGVSKIRMYI